MRHSARDGSGHQLRLDVGSVPVYLERVARQLPFKASRLVSVRALTEFGNNNYLFCLTVGSSSRARRYFLKQAQRFNRRSVQQGKPIAVDPSRMEGEVRLLQYLQRLWGSGIVPEVYFYDAANAVMLMSDVGRGGKLLALEFARGRVHPEVGPVLGRLLGKLHAATYHRPRPVGSNRVWQDKITKWLFGVHFAAGVNHFFPKRDVQQFYRSVARAPKATVWGDPVHRNIFVGPGRQLGLVDFDHTVRYDPMIDCGILLSHWVWMWVRAPGKHRQDSERALQGFMCAYWAAWRSRLSAAERKAMERRLLRWIGLYLLSRTDGGSGSYFAKWPAWERRIRELGKELFAGTLSPQTERLLSLLS